MSVSLYDKALLSKIKNWVKDENMKITGPEETRRLFEYIADVNNDEPITLPIIALRRQPRVTIDSVNKKALTFDGWRKNAGLDAKGTHKVDQLNAIEMTIRYNIDIYTRYAEEAEEYVRAFIFNIINYPKFIIEIPYNDARITHAFNIKLEPDIEDNSDIPERLIPGQFTRKTISVYVDNAYLFDYKIKDAIIINPEVQVETEIKLCTEIEDPILIKK